MTELLKQDTQIHFEVAVVRESRFRLKIETDFDIGVLDFEGFCEAGQRAKGLGGPVSCRGNTAQAQKRRA